LPKRIWGHLSANRPFWCIILLGILFTAGNIAWLERNILTVPPFALTGITSFSVVPLQLATYMGFVVSMGSLL
jgi:hypothetical protein